MTGKRIERLQIMLNEEELAAIDEWRFEHRMPSRSAAVRAMLNLALRSQPRRPHTDESLEEVVPSGDVGILQSSPAAERAMTLKPRRKILVIERERVAAAGIATLLEQAGHEVIATITGPKEWNGSSFTRRPDCAVIGDGLGPEIADRMADELTRHDIPFVFFKARQDAPIPVRFRNAPAINTDAGPAEFNASLERICA